MVKRIFALLLSLMLAFGAAITFVSCADTPEQTECTEHSDANGDGICDTEGCGKRAEPTPPSSNEHLNENGELILFKNGVPTFRFVLGTDAMTKNRADVEDLVNTLEDLSAAGSEIEIVPHGENAVDVEILVGTVTNRGNEYKLNKYEFGSKGYTVKQIGTKIIVLGGSDNATATAISYLKETVFGIKRNNEKFGDFVMAEDKNVTHVQTGYKITSVTIDGTPISDFTISYPVGDKVAEDIATKLQEKLYTDVGVWCEVKSEKYAAGKIFALRTIENDGEGGGFYANVKDGNFIVECEFADKFSTYFNEFISSNLFNKRGDLKFSSSFSYEPDFRTITYEDFGADGTDTFNDFAAIKAAHDEANKYLLKVRANDDAVYYITGVSGAESIIIKTDTYWGKAKFIIVDSDIGPDNPAATTNVFKITPDSEVKKYYPTGSSNISKLLKQINDNGGIKREEFTSFDLGLGRNALVYICNNNHKNYVRFGINKNSGQYQREFVYLNADGTIASDTGLLYDYDEITHIEVYFVDDRPITVDGGIFTTVANQAPSNYVYYKRGIDVNRSNTVIQNLEHYITGEGDTGAPYNGFIHVEGCSDVTVRDVILTAHKAYLLDGSSNNWMGTYDLSPTDCNRLLILRVTQSNFFEEDGVTTTKIGGGGLWGIMGSNRCKNLTYEECTLSRFDAHQGTLNASIINSNVGAITVIGGGTLQLIGSKVYAQNANLISLREDYGSTWNGDMLIKDTVMMLPTTFNGNTVNIISAYWNESELNNPGDKSLCNGPHDFGYDCYLPKSIILDNFTVSSSKVTTINLIGGTAAAKHSGNTVNKHFDTEYYEIIGKKNYTYKDPREYFSELTFVIDGATQN